MAATAGQIAKSSNIEIISRTVSATVTVGNIVSFSTTGTVLPTASVTTITSNFANGYGVAIETVTSGKARVAIGNTYVYAQSGTGDTVPMQSVKSDGAGDWTAQVITTDTASSITTVLAKHVGRYIGHEDEVDDPTAATTAEIGIIRLGF